MAAIEQLKVGDIVYVKPNANQIHPKDHPTFVTQMNKFLGGIYKVYKEELMGNVFLLEDLNTENCSISIFRWHADWLEKYVESKINVKTEDIIDLFEE